MSSTIYTRARVVLANEVLPQASVRVVDGLVTDIDHGTSQVTGAIDFDGDWLLPGLVEVHTDNLERHVTPRPKVNFPMQGAVQAHDAELACAGITTVLDAIGVGDPYGDGFRAHDQSALLGVLDRLEGAGLLRSQHLIHVRCELPAANARELFAPFEGHPRLRLLSLMDHTRANASGPTSRMRAPTTPARRAGAMPASTRSCAWRRPDRRGMRCPTGSGLPSMHGAPSGTGDP